MADILNLGEKQKAQRDANAKYAERVDLTAKMIPAMVEAVDKFYAMGANRDHVVQFLQATIDELNSGSAG